MAKRLFAYASKTKELPNKILDDLSDDQINELYSSGFSFQHKTLEEYINESGGKFILSERIDWG
ncbi:MAG: hypothetical protein IIZ61_02565, partial [Lachnospiraceae bacterium]|nr:hypothetical protein [Lachnospiraceae bacterium]